ncbi:hypothetical protein ACOMHN_034388 [Nucella lapillus]
MAEAPNSPTTLNSVDAEEASFDDVETSITGINMLLNNGFDEAFVLFEKYKDESALMHSGYSFVFFMQALMSFEEEKLAEALKVLQETEKRCEVSDGFVKSFKRKFTKKKKTADTLSLEDRVQRQVIVADSLLYQAILIFTNQDIPSYIRGGWHLRKAWKIYDKVHREVTRLKEKLSAHKITQMEAGTSWPDHSGEDLSHGFQDAVVSSSETISTPSSTTPKSQESPPTTNSNPSEPNGDVSVAVAAACLSEDTVARLLGAVNFGYGTFQLCISMVPPKILKLIEFLGFEGDREAGLACLDNTSHSQDMKAPLATLGLLWYHTVLRPFFALDGANNYSAGSHDAEAIIHVKEAAFPNSSLFLFFRGRIHRLRKETDLSFDMYQRAYEESKGQREIELMCLYEISWFHLIRLNWDKSLEGFERLRKESKWSKCYYSYLMAVCLGSQGLIQESHEIFREVPSLPPSLFPPPSLPPLSPSPSLSPPLPPSLSPPLLPSVIISVLVFSVCLGSQGLIQESHKIFREVPSLMKRKNNQIEVFCARRAEKLKKEAPTQEYCRLLTLELIFLWHTLPTCSPDDLRRLLDDGSQEGGEKNYPIVVRFCDSNGYIQSKLLANPTSTDSSTGENIFHLLDDTLTSLGIDWTKCLSLVCDNAATMTGLNKGVISYVRKKTPKVHLAGCVCHLLNLAAKKATKAFQGEFDFDDILRQISWYMSQSTNREQRLKKLQKQCGTPELNVIDHCPTRWLSMGFALRRLLQQWKPLQMFFEEECKKDIKGKSEEEKKRSSIRTRVHDFLKRSTAKLYALFLSFAMESFDILNQELQTDAAKIHVVKRSLEQFYRKLLISFVKPSALSSGTLLAVDFTAKYNMKDSKDILIGTATKQHISGLRDKVAEQFMKDVISFYQTACTYLKAKVFPVGEPLWKHAQVADIKLKETALFSSLDYFMERFPCLLPHEVGEDESPQEALTRAKDQLQAEFTDYQSWEVPSHLMTEEKVATEQLWAQITKVKDCNEAMRFQVLPRVMLGILLLPVSNAACERVFSVARRNRTVFRSSMGKDTTEALLVLKSKGGACFENTFADNVLTKCKAATKNSL